MKIILTQDVPNLGVVGDQIQVKPGYARNYLIPQSKAILATSKKSKELQHRMKFFEKLRQAAIEAAKGEAEKLKELQLEITKKSGSGGRLFGSVTSKDISELLQEKGFEIARRDIVSYEPIKTVGTHTVSVKLHTTVKVDVTIQVQGDAVESKLAPPQEDEALQTEIPSTETETVDVEDSTES
ncbi:MAG: 50S ribosomal protein L9 [SAR324 cluster bacterium]|nr:50S ribosomal protein L9 [SAR324 cluster bacterium]